MERKPETIKLSTKELKEAVLEFLLRNEGILPSDVSSIEFPLVYNSSDAYNDGALVELKAR